MAPERYTTSDEPDDCGGKGCIHMPTIGFDHCNGCVGSCLLKECGSDGCTGTCGDCSASKECKLGKCTCKTTACSAAGAESVCIGDVAAPCLTTPEGCVVPAIDQGTVCGPGQCQSGQCQAACPATPCSTPGTSGRACSDSTHSVACAVKDGCPVALADATDCGVWKCLASTGDCANSVGCLVPCGVNASCGADGACHCAPGFLSCDADPSGCEVDPQDDPLHCGSCPIACGAGEQCVGGKCIGGTVSIGPLTLDFGDVPVGTSKAKTATVTNGTAEEATLTWGLTGSAMFKPSVASKVAAGAKAQLSVTFAPPKAQVGSNQTASLDVAWSTPSGKQGKETVVLQGQAVTTAAYLTAEPAAVDFQNVGVGDVMAEDVSVLLGGDGQAVVTKVAVLGSSAFTATTDCETVALQSTGVNGCWVQVKFKPTSAVDYSATLRITSSLPTLDVPLQGTGNATCTDECSSDECSTTTVLDTCVQGPGDPCAHKVPQACPSWTVCDFPLAQCVPCGSTGQTCCANASCKAGLSCDKGPYQCIDGNPCAGLTWNPGLIGTSSTPGTVSLQWSAEPAKFDACVDSYVVLRMAACCPPPGGFGVACTASTDGACQACLTTGLGCDDTKAASGKTYFYLLYAVEGNAITGGAMGSPVPVGVK